MAQIWRRSNVRAQFIAPFLVILAVNGVIAGLTRNLVWIGRDKSRPYGRNAAFCSGLVAIHLWLLAVIPHFGKGGLGGILIFCYFSNDYRDL
jgi:hypothetical protein